MNTRLGISILLLSLGFILAFLPSPDKASLIIKPDKVLQSAQDINSTIDADKLAKLLIAEDSTLQVIDVRSAKEFAQFSIPGSIGLPYTDIVKHPDTLRNILNRGYSHNIFYSNGDLESNYAFVLSRGMGFKNVFVLGNGLNGWFRDIMNSKFEGQKITARENALFEIRARAKRLFIDINSLPDSLKTKYMSSKQTEAKKLDGGCE